MTTTDEIPTRMRRLTGELLSLIESVDEPNILRTEAAVAMRCGKVLAEIRAVQRMIGDRRGRSVRWMLSQGMSYAEIGAAIGVSRQRVEQLAKK